MSVMYQWEDAWAFVIKTNAVKEFCEQVQIEDFIASLSEKEQLVVLNAAPKEVIEKVKKVLKPAARQKLCKLKSQPVQHEPTWLKEFRRKQRAKSAKINRIVKRVTADLIRNTKQK